MIGLWLLLTVASARAEVTRVTLPPLRDLAGHPIATAQLRLVTFWASWCEDCRAELGRELPELGARHPELEIVAINTDREAGRAREWVTKEKITVTVARDEDRTWRRELKAFSVPHWALLKPDADGQFVVLASEPAYDRAHIEAALRAAGAPGLPPGRTPDGAPGGAP